MQLIITIKDSKHVMSQDLISWEDQNDFKLVWQTNRPWTFLIGFSTSFFPSRRLIPFDSYKQAHAHPFHSSYRSFFFLFSIFILFFLFSFSSPMAIWKIDSRTVTHSAQRDPGWEMSVTGRRARIRLEIGSPVQRTMKQWDCYVRGRKGEEPRALERSPFICKCIGETSDCFKKILSRIIRGN